ncbi:hypothetical protein PHLCEN_2v1962, partial [Hermanssonia centrifuga]
YTMHDILKPTSEILSKADCNLPKVILWLLNTQGLLNINSLVSTASGDLVPAFGKCEQSRLPGGGAVHK